LSARLTTIDRSAAVNCPNCASSVTPARYFQAKATAAIPMNAVADREPVAYRLTIFGLS
jgi:hypothetical protein